MSHVKITYCWCHMWKTSTVDICDSNHATIPGVCSGRATWWAKKKKMKNSPIETVRIRRFLSTWSDRSEKIGHPVKNRISDGPKRRIRAAPTHEPRRWCAWKSRMACRWICKRSIPEEMYPWQEMIHHDEKWFELRKNVFAGIFHHFGFPAFGQSLKIIANRFRSARYNYEYY